MPSCEQSPNPHGACSSPGTLNCPHGLWEISQGGWGGAHSLTGSWDETSKNARAECPPRPGAGGLDPREPGKAGDRVLGLLVGRRCKPGWESPSLEVGAQDLGRNTPYGAGGGEGFGENLEKSEGPTVQDWSGAGVCGPVGTTNTPFLLLGSMGRSWSCIS